MTPNDAVAIRGTNVGGKPTPMIADGIQNEGSDASQLHFSSCGTAACAGVRDPGAALTVASYNGACAPDWLERGKARVADSQHRLPV